MMSLLQEKNKYLTEHISGVCIIEEKKTKIERGCIMKKIAVWLRENLFSLILLALSLAVLILFIFPTCSKDYINYDSSYQLFLTKYNLSEIMRLLPLDYSPPFYAVALKGYSVLFGDSLFVLRTFSLFAVSGMIVLSAFSVKRIFSEPVSLLCCGLVLLSSTNLILIPEIRPNIFAQFFMMGSSLYAYASYFKSRKSDFILFTIFSVLAMYTQNFALVAVFSTYMMIIVICLITKNFEKLKSFFISGVICAVIYLPWLFVIIRQFKSVLNHYWKALDVSVHDIIVWIFQHPFNDFHLNYTYNIIYSLIIVFLLVFLFRAVKWDKLKTAKKLKEIIDFDVIRKKEILYFRCLFLILELVIPAAVFTVFCFTVYPVATDRYFYILEGTLFIGMSVLICKLNKKVLPALIVAVMLANSYSANIYMRKSTPDAPRDSVINQLKEYEKTHKLVFLHLHEFTLGVMMYYFPEAEHVVCDDTFTVLQTYDAFSKDIIKIHDASEIFDYTDEFFAFGNGMLACQEESAIDTLLNQMPYLKVEEYCDLPIAYSYCPKLYIDKVTADESDVQQK